MKWINKHINLSFGIVLMLALLNEWLSIQYNYWTIGWISAFSICVLGGMYVLIVKKRLMTWWVYPIMVLLPASLFPIVCLIIKTDKPMEAGIYNVSFKTRGIV